jgi:hypothetical protein
MGTLEITILRTWISIVEDATIWMYIHPMMDEAEWWDNDDKGHKELTHVYVKNEIVDESLSLSLSGAFGQMRILVLRMLAYQPFYRECDW